LAHCCDRGIEWSEWQRVELDRGDLVQIRLAAYAASHRAPAFIVSATRA
jgi:hypothetical protein